MTIPIPYRPKNAGFLMEPIEAPKGVPVPKVLPIRFFPDPILQVRCAPVKDINDEIKQLAYDMLLTMMKGNGIGLAAPQVGKVLRMFVADVEWPEKRVDSQSYIFINPTIEPIGDSIIKSVEGCLSFPEERFDQKRAKSVRIKSTDLEGKPYELEADGMLAVVIQHEMDHLDGKTVASGLSWLKRDLLRKKLFKRTRR